MQPNQQRPPRLAQEIAEVFSFLTIKRYYVPVTSIASVAPYQQLNLNSATLSSTALSAPAAVALESSSSGISIVVEPISPVSPTGTIKVYVCVADDNQSCGTVTLSLL